MKTGLSRGWYHRVTSGIDAPYQAPGFRARSWGVSASRQRTDCCPMIFGSRRPARELTRTGAAHARRLLSVECGREVTIEETVSLLRGTMSDCHRSNDQPAGKTEVTVLRALYSWPAGLSIEPRRKGHISSLRNFQLRGCIEREVAIETPIVCSVSWL